MMAREGQIVSFDVQLTTMARGNCGMLFAVPNHFYRKCHQEGHWFRCPNPKCDWPRQCYRDSDNQKLERELQKARMELATERSEHRETRRDRNHQERRASTYKGHLTRVKKRVRAGCCPYCKRHFANLERHIGSKHPEQEPEGGKG